MMLCITELTQQNMGWNRREISSDWLLDESQEHDRIQKKVDQLSQMKYIQTKEDKQRQVNEKSL
jgi:hypothetical protein